MALAVLVPAGGCSDPAEPAASQPAQVTVHLINQSDYEREVREQFPSYRWPARLSPDLDKVIAESGPSAGMLVPLENARIVLGMVNSCAWYLAWNRAHTRADRAGETAALQMIHDEVQKYLLGDPSGEELNRRIWSSARSGDNQLALSYVNANCGNVSWH